MQWPGHERLTHAESKHSRPCNWSSHAHKSWLAKPLQSPKSDACLCASAWTALPYTAANSFTANEFISKALKGARQDFKVSTDCENPERRLEQDGEAVLRCLVKCDQEAWSA